MKAAAAAAAAAAVATAAAAAAVATAAAVVATVAVATAVVAMAAQAAAKAAAKVAVRVAAVAQVAAARVAPEPVGQLAKMPVGAVAAVAAGATAIDASATTTGTTSKSARVGSSAQLEQRIRAGVVCLHDFAEPSGRALLCVRMRDPATGVARLFPPGGGLEPAESIPDAAARETLEETGLRVTVRPETERIARYPYTWEGVTRAITTHFFRAELLDDPAAPAPVDDASYNEGVVWLPLAELDRALGFEPAILEAVRHLISHAR